MSAALAIVVFICLLVVIGKILQLNAGSSAPPNPVPHTAAARTRPTSHPPNGVTPTYRPNHNRPKSNSIDFSPEHTRPCGGLHADLVGLRDAFTGAPLEQSLGLHQCTRCQVYYHTESVTVLRSDNGGRCMVCGGQALALRTHSLSARSRGRNHDPNLVTLATFHSHFGSVVTFEGVVREIRISNSGLDYAVMFEEAPWKKGLKVIFFQRSVADCGGTQFIQSLRGRQVRVRGLLTNHPIHGPQIVINTRDMIRGAR